MTGRAVDQTQKYYSENDTDEVLLEVENPRENGLQMSVLNSEKVKSLVFQDWWGPDEVNNAGYFRLFPIYAGTVRIEDKNGSLVTQIIR